MWVLPQKMEKAKQSDEPFFIEIYLIELLDRKIWIVAADEDIEFNGQHFTAIPIKRGTITKSMDNIVDEVDLEVGDCTDDFLEYMMCGSDFRGTRVTIGRILYPDSLTDGSWAWVFSGLVDSPSFSNGVFKCKVAMDFPKIQTPGRGFQLACNSEFGDPECKYDKGTLFTTVSSASGNRVTYGGNHPKDYWKYGTIKVGAEVRNIIWSDGSIVGLNANFLQPIAGKSCELNRGCNKTFEWCKEVYHNTANYSGFPAVPWECEYR